MSSVKVTIVKGVGLKAADINGKSDPYVIAQLYPKLLDVDTDTTPVRIGKTPVIQKAHCK